MVIPKEWEGEGSLNSSFWGRKTKELHQTVCNKAEDVTNYKVDENPAQHFGNDVRSSTDHKATKEANHQRSKGCGNSDGDEKEDKVQNNVGIQGVHDK